MLSIPTLACVFLMGSSAIIATGQTRPPVRIPQNIGTHEDVRASIEQNAELSPTLQRQLAAIGAARVRVDLLVSPAPLGGARRAETIINRYEAGFIKADIVVPPGPAFFELLSHELEHVLEQIEGVDLVVLARAGLANRDGRGVYETIRARTAGLATASEIAAGLRARNAAP